MLDQAQINFDSQSLWVLNIALAFVMFGIALSIDVSSFKPLFKKPKSVIIGVGSQFLILPAVTFLLVNALKPDPAVALGMFLVAACPGGNISNFITHYARGNDALSVSLTAIATLLAVGMTPLNFSFWAGVYPPTNQMLKAVSIVPQDMVVLVALILGLPLILGMSIRKKYPQKAIRVSLFFKKASLLFFISLVFLALQKNFVAFQTYVMQVFWLVLFHNMMAFLCGFSLGTFFRLPWKDVKTITIETGIQNSGLGLLLIFTFFNGLGGMAILAAFWGIWHLVSGLILGTVFNLMPNSKTSTL